MYIHLKNYPCNDGKAPKGEPYTVNKHSVTCPKCKAPKSMEKPKQKVGKAKTAVKAKPKK